jgi:hypothetical protein
MIPDDVRRFILASVPSVPFLEAVLWLRQRSPEAHRAADVAAALYVGERTARALLEEAAAAGLVEAGPAPESLYRWQPASPEVETIVGRVVDCYRADTVAVARLIHDTTQRSAQRFAEAFRLRKDR